MARLEKKEFMKRLRPLQSIRAKCIDCAGRELRNVRECLFDGVMEKICPLYPMRIGKGHNKNLKRIRKYCLWCCNHKKAEVKRCTSVKCPLWEYRFGKNFRKASSCQKTLKKEGILEAILLSKGIGKVEKSHAEKAAFLEVI